ncbi:coenzyme F420-0:L-glutamate ligase [Candidatus Bathyarchaeota archaeon]|nr:coenzyme F420-0:L-glutamate ligase [Candidatus Bathyarchaeota archaeon]NIR15479.1 coenzyme F420-0:L-glutamate ligase [Desulfobacterales bacterium]NIU81447.1 coenzyme F420-0:L-glutamate ligase [Candidatus Bathyarchaeota archaeon]NIV67336.1 coenzyme F420-0:L-glutamate ligase [Candidatus Bathyarchaeota archaeon]NIW16489.1 coenzyme F420-0:L-glutamate ligase [Candidatus Bathyarchaeota archaeon]
MIKIIGVKNMPVIEEGDDLAKLICSRAEQQGTPIEDGDIIIISHIIVSRAEGTVVNLNTVKPSNFARTLAEECNKDPPLVEAILRESKTLIRTGDGNIIAETQHGFICANAGIDRSNVPGDKNVAPLPRRPDHSASEARRNIQRITGKDVAIIIADTHGRPLRKGGINIAIGVAGIKPILDLRGRKDLFGYVLKAKRTAIADELASAAELVIGQVDEGIPVAIIRGYSYPRSETAKATQLIRPREKDLFI